MRTEQQIKRKLNELVMQKKSLETQASESSVPLKAEIERLEDSILLLEWVLNEPAGKYHA